MAKARNMALIAIPVIAILVFSIYFIQDAERHSAFKNVETDVCDYYFDGFDLRIAICMYNPNDVTAELDRADVLVYAGGNKAADVTLPYDVSIPPKTQERVDADIALRLTGLAGTLVDGILSKPTDIRAEITAHYDSPLGTFTERIEKPIAGSVSEFVSDEIPDMSEYDTSMTCHNLINKQLETVAFYVEAARWLHNNGYVVDDENMELYLADSGYDGTELDSFVLYENGCLDDPREGITNSPHMDLMQKERAIKLLDELSSYYTSG